MKIETIRRPWEKERAKSYGSTTKSTFYQSPEWTKTRKAFIRQHPFCVECGARANVVDHKIRIKDGGDKLDWSNLQSMCTSCHNKKDNNAGKRK